MAVIATTIFRDHEDNLSPGNPLPLGISGPRAAALSQRPIARLARVGVTVTTEVSGISVAAGVA